MTASDPISILLAHNRWATEQILKTMTKLTDEQIHQRFEMGPGSLHDTAVHILGAMQGWGDLLAGREQRPRLEAERHTPQELLELLRVLADDIDVSAVSHSPAESVSGSRGGRSYTFTRGAVLTHVTTHGMHHRAQCLNMLRQLAVKPLPPSAVVEWVQMVDTAGAVDA